MVPHIIQIGLIGMTTGDTGARGAIPLPQLDDFSAFARINVARRVELLRHHMTQLAAVHPVDHMQLMPAYADLGDRRFAVERLGRRGIGGAAMAKGTGFRSTRAAVANRAALSRISSLIIRTVTALALRHGPFVRCNKSSVKSRIGCRHPASGMRIGIVTAAAGGLVGSSRIIRAMTAATIGQRPVVGF